jgi:hypothetical protein
MTQVNSGIQPTGAPDFRTLTNGAGARSAFGGLTHSLADFYSHSNWVELAINANQSPGLAPIFPTCTPAALPTGLQTGFFALTLGNGLDGCPDVNGTPAPPAPFVQCHLTLNKDEPDRGHGQDIVPGNPGLTYHQLAVQLATTHTLQLYNQIRAGIASSFTPAVNDMDGECVANHVFQASRVERCLRIDGAWTVSRTDPTSQFPPLGQTWSFAHIDWEIVNGVIPSQVCGTLTLQVRATDPGKFEGTVLGCTEQPPPQFCPAQAQIPVTLTRVSQGVLEGILTAIEVEDKTGCPITMRTPQSFQLHR